MEGSAETLGAFLHRTREAAGLTREAVAEAVGWKHPNSVRHIESGHTDVPRDLLPKLLTTLGVAEEEWPDVLRLPRRAETNGEPAATVAP